MIIVQDYLVSLEAFELSANKGLAELVLLVVDNADAFHCVVFTELAAPAAGVATSPR